MPGENDSWKTSRWSHRVVVKNASLTFHSSWCFVFKTELPLTFSNSARDGTKGEMAQHCPGPIWMLPQQSMLHSGRWLHHCYMVTLNSRYSAALDARCGIVVNLKQSGVLTSGPWGSWWSMIHVFFSYPFYKNPTATSSWCWWQATPGSHLPVSNFMSTSPSMKSRHIEETTQKYNIKQPRNPLFCSGHDSCCSFHSEDVFSLDDFISD